MATPIRLTKVSGVIARCWTLAEERTRALVRERYWGPTEEQVTFLFSGELRVAVESASNSKEFESGFAADLVAACPQLRAHIMRVASGLAGSVNFHNRRHEAKRSAADVGLVITQPWAERSTWGTEEIYIRPGCTRALLAQAKLGKAGAAVADRTTWGRLTRRQAELIPERAQYYSLLLYRLADAESRALAPFRWQLCKGYSVREIQQWLRRGDFPAETDSATVIHGLASGAVGTDDPEVCSSIANPTKAGCQYVEIRISWPDGRFPPGGVKLRQHADVQRQHLEQRSI